MQLDSPVEVLEGVGVKIAEAFHRLGIFTLYDLLHHVPFRYIDASSPIRLSQIQVGTECLVHGQLISLQESITPRKRMRVLEAVIEEDGEQLHLRWFNQVYIKKVITIGQKYYFYGKITFDWSTKTKSLQSPQILKEPAIIPVYHETYGLSSGVIHKIVRYLQGGIKTLPDPLPEDILLQYHLRSRADSLEIVHFPKSMSDIAAAQRRLGFEELLILGLILRTVQKPTATAPKISFDKQVIQEFVSGLPFKLTNDQRKVAWQIIQDMDKTTPMQRLIMGDVGSGKTVVAALGSLAAANQGYQSLWLAPTEVLAFQHYETLSSLFRQQKISLGIWTGSRKEADLKKADVIIGTHALLEPTCIFGNIGLIVIDEQHRFGVAQRGRLREITQDVPHFISMTATPIPRTLALTLYGSLSISIIDELPKNRLPIITKVIESRQREQAYQVIRQEISQGHQAFIVTPLIESQLKDQLFDPADKKAALIEYDRLKTAVFPEFQIGLLHGKLKSKEKSQIMTDFKNKKIDILVATSVIEVGIDIPNATVMMIENAESFGLAQLHQLRGRVGRGKFQSYCLLIANHLSDITLKRLSSMEKYHSGFKLAEIDLEIRGPGSLVGLRQSGLPDLRLASLADTLSIEQARSAADTILAQGLPIGLKTEMNRAALTNHLE